jgi:hypothetical protein
MVSWLCCAVLCSWPRVLQACHRLRWTQRWNLQPLGRRSCCCAAWVPCCESMRCCCQTCLSHSSSCCWQAARQAGGLMLLWGRLDSSLCFQRLVRVHSLVWTTASPGGTGSPRAPCCDAQWCALLCCAVHPSNLAWQRSLFMQCCTALASDLSRIRCPTYDSFSVQGWTK